MKTEFTALVQKLAAEQGKEILFDTTKCKAFLADYTRGEYLNERRLLLQVVEAGITIGIMKADDLATYKQMAARKLQEEYFLASNVAAGVVDMLTLVLRGAREQKIICPSCGKELQSEWKACPYCLTPAKDTATSVDKNITTTIILNSERMEKGIQLIEPKDSTKGIVIFSNWGKKWQTDSKIVIPEKIDGLKVTKIGVHAFSDCKNLTNILIPNSVTSIGNHAFWNCRELTSITIPNSVTSIEEYAFAWCSGLTDITIPNSVASVGECAFLRCDSLPSNICSSIKRRFPRNPFHK
jgi:hypothetical protein